MCVSRNFLFPNNIPYHWLLHGPLWYFLKISIMYNTLLILSQSIRLLGYFDEYTLIFLFSSLLQSLIKIYKYICTNIIYINICIYIYIFMYIYTYNQAYKNIYSKITFMYVLNSFAYFKKILYIEQYARITLVPVELYLQHCCFCTPFSMNP